MNIIINNMKLISSWSYNLDKNTDCTICRSSLNSDSIYNIEKGIRSTLQPLIKEAISIPKFGEAESLNAAVATGIILSHWKAQ